MSANARTKIILDRLARIKALLEAKSEQKQQQGAPAQQGAQQGAPHIPVNLQPLIALETRINDYLSRRILDDCKINKIQLQPLTDAERKELKAVNKTILSIQAATMETFDQFRLYINKVIRLKNQIVKAKYQLSYNNLIGGGSPSGAIGAKGTRSSSSAAYRQFGGTPELDRVDVSISGMKSHVASLIQEQDEVIALFESFIKEFEQVQAASTGVKIDCKKLYAEITAQRDRLVRMIGKLNDAEKLAVEKKKDLTSFGEPGEMEEIIRVIKSLGELPTIPDFDTDECEDLATVSAQYKPLYHDLSKYALPINNAFEDLQGAVRIYVRLNTPFGESKYATIDPQDNRYIISNLRQKKKYGEFFSVYPASMSNAQIYDSSDPSVYYIKGMFDQLKSGYSNFLFGYGYSGSGKTYSLFGTDKVPGLLQLGLADLSIDKNYKVEYKYIFEIYGQIMAGLSDSQFNSHIYTYLDPDHDFDQTFGVKSIPVNTPISYDDKAPIKETINSVLKQVTQIRLDEKYKHIKSTINNPESSRGHLFLVFKVTDKKKGKTSYLTVIDMAGIENPLEIAHSYFNIKGPLPPGAKPIQSVSISQLFRAIGDYKERKELNTTLKVDKIEEELTAQERGEKVKDKGLDYHRDRILAIINEGLFINETINHLKFHLLKRQGTSEQKLRAMLDYQKDSDTLSKNVETNTKPFNKSNYKPERYFINPVGPNTGKILMVPVIEILESMATRQPSKFAMLTLVRTDRGTFVEETLKYADSLLYKGGL